MQEIFNAMGALDFTWDIWKILLRLFLAIIAGFLVGLESWARSKDAGIKTHTILCLTACLLMIISKYGFYELAQFEGIQYDASRVASTIISGLCFVGAGMVFYRQGTIRGLTSAVSMCLTIAIGMCFGSGLLITAGVITIISLLLQLIWHSKLAIFRSRKVIIVKAAFILSDNYIETFKETFNIKHFRAFKIVRRNDKCVAEVEFLYRIKVTSEELAKKVQEEANILMFEKIEQR